MRVHKLLLQKSASKRKFLPHYLARSVSEIDFDYLKKAGIKACFIDLDDTTVLRGSYDVTPTIVKALKNQPLKCYIATNRPKSRDLKDLKEHLNADGVIHPRGMLGKPTKHYYRQALKDAGVKPDQAVMIGDRVIQDILGANRSGMRSLKVNKLGPAKNTFDRLLSAAENGLVRRFASQYEQV
jgi:HAD superfamily phosphatase (TIGR01668 family)